MKTNVQVILLAGGIGSRFGANKPKQFVKIKNMPLIIYTLRKLQVELVSGITIVCVKEWHSYLKEIIEQYQIDKVINIVEGGSSAFESICNGFNAVNPNLKDNDVIVIHDSVRPLLPQEVLEDAVNKAIEHGNGCASMKSIEGLVLKDNEEFGTKPADRYNIMRVQTPQAYRCNFFRDLLDRATKDNKKDFPYADGLCINYGKPLYFSKSFTGNMKITTKPDIAYFKAMLSFSDEELMGENM